MIFVSKSRLDQNTVTFLAAVLENYDGLDTWIHLPIYLHLNFAYYIIKPVLKINIGSWYNIKLT